MLLFKSFGKGKKLFPNRSLFQAIILQMPSETCCFRAESAGVYPVSYVSTKKALAARE